MPEIITDAAIRSGLALDVPADFLLEQGSDPALYNGPCAGLGTDDSGAYSIWTADLGTRVWFDVVSERNYTVAEVRAFATAMLAMCDAVEAAPGLDT